MVSNEVVIMMSSTIVAFCVGGVVLYNSLGKVNRLADQAAAKGISIEEERRLVNSLAPGLYYHYFAGDNRLRTLMFMVFFWFISIVGNLSAAIIAITELQGQWSLGNCDNWKFGSLQLWFVALLLPVAVTPLIWFYRKHDTWGSRLKHLTAVVVFGHFAWGCVLHGMGFCKDLKDTHLFEAYVGGMVSSAFSLLSAICFWISLGW